MNRKPGIVIGLSVALGISLCVLAMLVAALLMLLARLPSTVCTQPVPEPSVVADTRPDQAVSPSPAPERAVRVEDGVASEEEERGVAALPPCPALARGIAVGDPRERVVALLGGPRGEIRDGAKECMVYEFGLFTLEQGRVAGIRLLSQEQWERRKTLATSPAVAELLRQEGLGEEPLPPDKGAAPFPALDRKDGVVAEPSAEPPSPAGPDIVIIEDLAPRIYVSERQVVVTSVVSETVSAPVLRGAPRVSTGAPVISRRYQGKPDVDRLFWLDTGTGLRHNWTCRTFKKFPGRYCGPGEGKACPFCEGKSHAPSPTAGRYTGNPDLDRLFWIEDRTQLRHKRSCTLFKKFPGRYCGPSEGRPCLFCEGR